MGGVSGILGRLWSTSGFMQLTDVRQIIMIALACVLLYMGIHKKYEPLLLVGIAFGMLLTNLPGSGLYHPELWDAYIEGTLGLGEVIHYSIKVENDGDQTVKNIVITDELTGEEWTVDSLAPGKEKVFETSYKVTKADAEAGEVVNEATVTGNKPDDPDDPVEEGDKEPNPTVVKLVIRYWVDGKFDHQITRYEKPGTKYDVVSPPKAGYSVDIERVKGTLTKDTEYDVHYTRTEYTLTILYQYADGTTAAETYTATLNTGGAYSVVSPVIEGYRTDLTIVEGIMPARNVTVTVIYVQRPAGPGLVTIDDFMTPLGLGLGGLNIGDCVE